MLYVVATPIGNLKDITLRALETLKFVDKIYCEDTRRTKQLLAAYEINKPVDSYHHHSDYKIPGIIRELQSGIEIAYVSDAGTPGVADPIGKLVKACFEADVTVLPIPGPSAVTALLSVAGIYANEYSFKGYVPTKKGRQTFVKNLLNQTEPVVFFETAPRLRKLLEQLTEFGANSRQLIVGRELTKQFEEIQKGTPGQLLEKFVLPKGEFVIVLSPE